MGDGAHSPSSCTKFSSRSLRLRRNQALRAAHPHDVPSSSEALSTQQHEPHKPTPASPPAPLEQDAFTDDGTASLYSTDSDERDEADGARRTEQTTLGGHARQRFIAMLRTLTPRRERIARCMAFALDNTYAADDIAALLIESLLIPTTPLPRKLARLHVLSDIVHNSAAPVPYAWRYRDAFLPYLRPLFTHLGDIVHAFPGRIKAEAVQQQFVAVLDSWDEHLVYPPFLLDELLGALTTGNDTASQGI